MIGDVGSVVGSTATTKLALGLLRPSLRSIRNHARTIISAWAASIVMFVVLGFLAPALSGTFSLSNIVSLLIILLLANLFAVTGIVLLSFGISILTFQRGLDPDNFVLPIESSFADSLMTISLLVSLVIVMG
jgi:mgtE-like transporter